MELKETPDSPPLLTFESRDEVDATAMACREAIVHISRNSFRDGQYHDHVADHTFIPLSELAISAEAADASMRTDPVSLYILKLALKTFGDPSHTKQAVNELAATQNYFTNRHIEKRVYLGRVVANQMLESIDPGFAAESLDQSRRRYARLITAERA